MKLIIGGAYQGKREYAVKEYGIKEEEIFTCTPDGAPDFSAPCLDRFEEFVYYCVTGGLSAREILEREEEKWRDSVILCREIFSGVVPVDVTVRAWREETGRVMTWLAGRAERVTRMFCGIPQQLK
ncbi:MAG: bifunctional adenosylcobinamide kinase/adenosylcobinamide-phosphate guanylyltransferase [Oscillospiraceae bacterium]|jgi:adenosyl cobinamide kinase/adenosyl cobinamide phosphate guanylyltransferase|nr:bifunctional adenosylcobinamide kinase/adenosylcobinamide-phosphate guanylyltransferase [Oscillospiraceae bacterium]